MRKLSSILVMLVCLACFIREARAGGFTASLDRDTIALGETATLSLNFTGDEPQSLTPPSMPGLDITDAGTSHNFTINNGAMSAMLTINYEVSPQRAGVFTIPGAVARINGQIVTAPPLKLTVTQSAAAANSGGNQADSQIAFARLSLPKQQVYAGETIIADLQLFFRADLQLGQQPQITGENTDGFAVGKITGNNTYRTQVGNTIYNVIPAKMVLTATKTGTLHVGPVNVGLVVLIPVNNRQQDNFFDPFGMMRQREEKSLSLATDTLEVKSLPLPAQNVPANFNGAIGNFTMTATAGPTQLTAGDPLTVRVQISGRGTFDSVALPDQSGLKDFKIYPPTSKTDTSDQLGLEGTKTFEEIATPQTPGVHEWPAFSFSYFNPDDNQYHTLTQPAVPLVVRAAGTTPLPALAANKPAAAENQPQQDILPVKENLGTLSNPAAPLLVRPGFLAAQSLPVLAFFAAFIWRKRADHLANNPRLRRQRAVSELVASGLNDLKQLAAANKSEEFFALLFRLLQEQLGERLDCPASAITENVIDEHAVLRNAPPAARDALREQFQLCNQARYAPVRGTGELNSVAVQFEKLIRQLQELNA